MKLILRSLIGAALLTNLASAGVPGTLTPPVRSALVTASGDREVVSILEIGDDGLRCLAGGNERLFAWDELRPASAFDAMRRAAKRDNADEWLWIGATMLSLDEEKLADRAFNAAERADASAKSIIDRANRLHAQGSDPRAALRDEPLREPTEAGPKTKRRDTERTSDVHRWPVLSDAEQQQAIIDSRRWAQQLLNDAGFRADLHESEHYLVFATSGGERNARELARSLEGMHRSLLKILEIDEKDLTYHGKCAVFIVGSRGDYERFTMNALGHDGTKTGGVYTPRDKFSAVTTFSDKPSREALESVMVHETTHAFMHRYKSGYKLPTWANEGLADFMAAQLVPNHDGPKNSWNKAREYVLNGRDVGEIMEQSYADGSWPDEYSYPVSHMLVRFMIQHKAEEFRAWIDDIKDGRNWVESMAERFSPSPDRTISPDVLARGFADQMRRERTYTRD